MGLGSRGGQCPRASCPEPQEVKSIVRLEIAPRTQLPKHLPKRCGQVLRRNRVQQVANLWICRHLVDAKQARRIVAPLVALHVPPMRQERGRLHEEHRKRPNAASAILYTVFGPLRRSGRCVTVEARIERKRSNDSVGAIPPPLNPTTTNAAILAEIGHFRFWNSCA